MNEFQTYLSTKKIDWKLFSKGDPEQYKEFENIFNQISPKSFTDQKLYLINGIRRMYPLVEVGSEESSGSKKQVKPKMVPRIKK